ncbi:hypothetical protein GCWU000325_02367 [Alloprevotella tannerae ATCC 51259]|uniref:Uncharacterized protein n=1 Tax=Alloprevotella tannerae ATCC 51259 TaxID=626522 RepID=C9LJF5_9BACT|nr:hypothetical protein GCWU000325_02367 [Alloprevotella tannerae ATCC 51259]
MRNATIYPLSNHKKQREQTDDGLFALFVLTIKRAYPREKKSLRSR